MSSSGSELPDELWDGNGGTLDARKAPQRDLIIALHLKVDQLFKIVGDQEKRLREAEKALIENAATSALKGRQLNAAWIFACAVIGALLYLAVTGGH